LLFSQQLFAGTIYRFEDQNGVITMSKSLPPYAAQKGYDVLNDKSLRLIKRVDPALTPEQIAEKEKQLAIQQEQERLAAQEVEQKREQRRQQQIADQTLLASYQSAQDLISARDTDLSYRQTQLEKAKQHLESSKVKLQQAQQDAAEQELSGKTISVNMNKRLTAAQQEIDNAQQNIARLEQEIEQLNKQYESDLERLKLLLSQKQN
jgi:vacuolar-type H+-ATPase subunit I/STV1